MTWGNDSACSSKGTPDFMTRVLGMSSHLWFSQWVAPPVQSLSPCHSKGLQCHHQFLLAWFPQGGAYSQSVRADVCSRNSGPLGSIFLSSNCLWDWRWGSEKCCQNLLPWEVLGMPESSTGCWHKKSFTVLVIHSWGGLVWHGAERGKTVVAAISGFH